MAKYRKRPVVIEAERWWYREDEDNDGAYDNLHGGIEDRACPHCGGGPHLRMTTLEGAQAACSGDWIITGDKGEVYPCKPDIFEATYEPVGERDA